MKEQKEILIIFKQSWRVGDTHMLTPPPNNGFPACLSEKGTAKSLGEDIENPIPTRVVRSPYDACHLILDHP